MTQPDLSAFAYQMGKLIDTETHAIVKRARDAGINLELGDIEIRNGFRLIDGMDANDWLDHQGA